MDNTKEIINLYSIHKDTRIVSKLIELPETEVRYVLALNNVALHNKNKENNYTNKYYKYNRQHMHRTIMSAHINRPLRSDEFVHHIDFNKSNNNLSNLVVVNPTEHATIETNTRFLLGALIRKGIVSFDKETKCYQINM